MTTYIVAYTPAYGISSRLTVRATSKAGAMERFAEWLAANGYSFDMCVDGITEEA